VVCHQTPRMHLTCEASSKFLKVEEIKRVVPFREEARTPIVAALDNMHGYFGKHQAGTARHTRINAFEVRRVDAPENVVCP